MTADQVGGAEVDFQLGDWLVRPRLNRLERAGHTMQLEPKMMDVLSLLASRVGDVVSKREINDTVWADVFVSESVITRAIAGLRKAFDDDASNPRFIETIAKRGYRLIAPVTTPAGGGSRSRHIAPAPGRAGGGPGNPFAVGTWVRGERFHGRARHIADILDGPRHAVWVLGMRSVGKTSLLRQLELMTLDDASRPEVPLFWDLQGAVTPTDLRDGLREALLDTGDRFVETGIDLDAIQAVEDAVAVVSRLRRELHATGRRLLLLCDEAEELIALGRSSPPTLRKLRRALQSHDDLRSVLAASSRLWELAEQRDHTSPFLHGFTPPVYLGALDDDEAAGLIRQAPAGTSGGQAPSEDDIAQIQTRCGNHPALIQAVCARWMDSDTLELALREVTADRFVTSLFAVDWELFGHGEREILDRLARGAVPPDELFAGRADVDLHHLEQLGLVARSGSGSLELRNQMFADWLRDRST